jgi:hypothetical protein
VLVVVEGCCGVNYNFEIEMIISLIIFVFDLPWTKWRGIDEDLLEVLISAGALGAPKDGCT